MTNNEISLVFSYIYAQRVQLERSIDEAQARFRYRNLTETECLELALLKERYNTFLEVTGHIKSLLNLNKKRPVNSCIICGIDIPKDRQVCSKCYKRYKGEC